MALINHAKREINAKLVFYGPGLSGKSTNLNYIFRKLKPEHRGKLKIMNIEKDRMLFFDFAPAGQGKVGTYNVRFHIYSIIGESTSGVAWKMVLKGADGLVFVADSAPERMQANIESLENLRKILRGYGMSIKDLPGVLQCNKRDTDNALPMDEMVNNLNYGGFTVMPTVAGKGEGILESLFSLMKRVLGNLRESGHEVEKEPEQVAGIAEAAPVLKKEEPPVTEPASIAPEEEPPAVPAVTAEAGIDAAPQSDVAAGSAEVMEPVIEIAGEPESLAGGRLRLPLNIRVGGLVKKVSVMVTVGLELE